MINKLPKDICPENKVTPALAAKKSLGLHPLVMSIDECQEVFTHERLGKKAAELATAIIKRGRALGVILLLGTQRPDADSLPKAISANVGIRFCLQVMGRPENDMVLGTSMYKNGIRATSFTAEDLGVGYLVGAGPNPQIVRSYYIDNANAEVICQKARAARAAAGTLPDDLRGLPHRGLRHQRHRRSGRRHARPQAGPRAGRRHPARHRPRCERSRICAAVSRGVRSLAFARWSGIRSHGGRHPGRAALIYQHSDLERQREVAAGLDQLVRARREAVDDQASGTDMARDA
ncbi:hypothetical protein [Streptomyces atratus]|uniref:hypothetical protein n=1 Tax=Streptomyces atratus TaxID=1893 RepID=UPI0033977273